MKPNPRQRGGLIHSYQGYDPKRFPSPSTPPPDLTSAAMEHLMLYGSERRLTPEELADAIEIDPSEIAGLGPSIEALIALLEERKRKILETYDPKPAARQAGVDFQEAARDATPPGPKAREALDRAVRRESIPELERLWYRSEQSERDFARDLLALIESLGAKYEIEALDNDYPFTGRTALDVPGAFAVKEELEAIDRLLEQLREARKNAKVALIDMDALRRFVDEVDLDDLKELGKRIEEYIEQQLESQGLENTPEGLRPTPAALRVFQKKLLTEIFSSLEASRTGRHEGPIVGEGAVELPQSRPYEFGDSAAHIDLPNTVVNASIRAGAKILGAGSSDSEGPPGPLRIGAEDIDVHDTKNNPRAATSVIMDMSGSMRYGGQYLACKKMAIALDGLIRSEYPGDHLSLIEMYTFAKLRRVGEIAELMPKPVTTRDPWVRLKVDMSDPEVTETMVHPHFTNIQRALQLARQVLSGQDTPNRQVFLITDGLPTAHYEGEHLYLLYPPDPLTERATMREAALCAREGITINIFLVPSWSQDSDDIAFAHRLAETTRGRVLFTAGDDLERFVLWDYVSGRRKILG